MAGYNPRGDEQPMGPASANTPTNVAVTNSSTQIVAANEDRRSLILSNTGNQDIFISGDGTAQVDKGFVLAKGLTVHIEAHDVTVSFHGITNAGSTNIAIQEFE